MIVFYEIWGMYLVSWFPGVITLRVTLPFDKILKML